MTKCLRQTALVLATLAGFVELGSRLTPLKFHLRPGWKQSRAPEALLYDDEPPLRAAPSEDEGRRACQRLERSPDRARCTPRVPASFRVVTFVDDESNCGFRRLVASGWYCFCCECNK